ncbi:MAG: N-acetylglucosaminyl-diphospho-decaprenol L-rhamnosyltransferase [Solirubrobacteraceae bacterium]|nr:N-acetylglucosaminyl-diphospho-decaprenol L-rhamnosyltransferase [Solirubrobacteraceae bacterium]
MDYSIVVVTWRSAGELARLVESMRTHLGEGPELVVVDNASDDDPEAAARRWAGGPVEFVRLERNLGFGAASNEGVRRASRDVVVLLNPDTELVDSSLDALAAEAARRGAIVGPRLLESDGSVQPSAEGPLVGVWPWVGALVPGAVQPSALAARTEPWRLERSLPVSWLTGACLAAPRDVLLSLGPFDADIELYGEDTDLGLRARAAGVESWFCPDVARVVHHGAASTSRRFGDDERAERKARNRRAAIRRAYGDRAERRARRADTLRFGLRAAAKRALRRDAERDRRDLRAVRRA